MTKKDAVRIVVKCAEKYKENLLGRSLLFILLDKQWNTSYLEVFFSKSNFLHLTGLKIIETDIEEKEEAETVEHGRGERTGISASEFFDRCINHKVSEDVFEFAPDGTTELKLQVLSNMMSANLGANSVGFYNNSMPRLYTERLAGGVTGCMGFRKDPKQRMVPNTVLKEDIRRLTSSRLRIIATYRKFKSDNLYAECVYRTKKVDWAKIKYPDEYAYLSALIENDMQ